MRKSEKPDEVAIIGKTCTFSPLIPGPDLEETYLFIHNFLMFYEADRNEVCWGGGAWPKGRQKKKEEGDKAKKIKSTQKIK